MSRIEPNYWIGVVSRSHVMIGVEGGFVQLNHGKKAPVQRLKAGDMLAEVDGRNEPSSCFGITAEARAIAHRVAAAVRRPNVEPGPPIRPGMLCGTGWQSSDVRQAQGT